MHILPQVSKDRETSREKDTNASTTIELEFSADVLQRYLASKNVEVSNCG